MSVCIADLPAPWARDEGVPAGHNVVEGVENDFDRRYARGVERPVVGARLVLAHSVQIIDGVACHLQRL
jgi:hypothetical protein